MTVLSDVERITSTAPARKSRVAKRRVRENARAWPRWQLSTFNAERSLLPLFGLCSAMVALGQGVSALGANEADNRTLAVFGLLAFGALVLAIHSLRESGRIDPAAVVSLGLCLVVISILGASSEYFGVLAPYGIMHRSVVSGAFLIGLSVPVASTATYHLLGATPRADDAARYPLILVPVALVLASYAALVTNLVMRAAHELQDPAGLGLRIFIQPFIDPSIPPAFQRQAGLLNQLGGTGLLMLLTTLISLPIGVGTGIFVSEFAGDWEKRVVSSATTALRGISALLFALAAVGVVRGSTDQPWLQYVAGFYEDNGTLRTERGSFLFTAVVLSALVVPIIARATEVGFSSLPRDLREGSAALGARPEYTLARITLPWAIPNILTSVLIGCAEVAGSVSVLLFIAGTGSRGVAPFTGVASLAFAVFYAQSSPFKAFRDLMRPYQYSAALELLVVALGLTVLALVFKRRYASRYEGS